MDLDKLDRIDRKLLDALQLNGRLTNADLASQVGLSESPCSRRVKRLEESGYVTGYHAHLDHELLGVGLTIFVGIKIRRHASDEVMPFEEWARSRPEVAACFLVAGEFDYMLHVVARDLKAYEGFLSDQLLKNEAIADIRSTIAVRNVKAPFGIMSRPIVD